MAKTGSRVTGRTVLTVVKAVGVDTGFAWVF
jgi:hypothetical protein